MWKNNGKGESEHDSIKERGIRSIIEYGIIILLQCGRGIIIM